MSECIFTLCVNYKREYLWKCCIILSLPRTTGDGYYECAIADPEGNYVEITV